VEGAGSGGAAAAAQRQALQQWCGLVALPRGLTVHWRSPGSTSRPLALEQAWEEALWERARAPSIAGLPPPAQRPGKRGGGGGRRLFEPQAPHRAPGRDHTWTGRPRLNLFPSDSGCAPQLQSVVEALCQPILLQPRVAHSRPSALTVIQRGRTHSLEVGKRLGLRGMGKGRRRGCRHRFHCPPLT
jgi:hypothetical protein